MNKNSRFLLTRLQDIYGDDFHPIMKMAENCATIQDIADSCKDEMLIDEVVAVEGEDKEIDVDVISKVISLSKLANENWEKLAPYIAPKLKATEITGEEGGPIQIAEVRRTIVDS